jgi:uncharacterized protein YoxC
LAWKEQLERFGSYQWLSKPCHIEELWQAVANLSPSISGISLQSEGLNTKAINSTQKLSGR